MEKFEKSELQNLLIIAIIGSDKAILIIKEILTDLTVAIPDTVHFTRLLFLIYNHFFLGFFFFLFFSFLLLLYFLFFLRSNLRAVFLYLALVDLTPVKFDHERSRAVVRVEVVHI